MTPPHLMLVEGDVAAAVQGVRERYSVFESRKPSPEPGVLVQTGEQSSAVGVGSVGAGAAAADPHVRLERPRTQDLRYQHSAREKI